MISPSHCGVSQTNDAVYVVDLANTTCNCGWFQENAIPCDHAFSRIFAITETSRLFSFDHHDLEKYLPDEFRPIHQHHHHHRHQHHQHNKSPLLPLLLQPSRIYLPEQKWLNQPQSLHFIFEINTDLVM